MRIDRRGLSFAVCSVLGASACLAAPRVIEESASFVLPNSAYALNGSIAVDGDYILVAGYSPYHHVDSEFPQPQRNQAAFLFQRSSNGAWNYVTTLVEQLNDPADGADMRVAMDNGVAAVTLSGSVNGVRRGLLVFERGSTGWVNRPATGVPRGTDLEIDAGTIVASDGECSWDADVFRRNAAGQWYEAASITGAFRGCAEGYRGGDVDVSGTSLIVSNGHREHEQSSAAYIYEGPIGAWTRTILTSPSGATGGPFGFYVTLQADTAVTTGDIGRGSDVFVRSSPGSWNHVGDAVTADALLAGWPLYLQLEGNLLVHHSRSDGGSLALFQRNSSGEFEHAARLIARGPALQQPAISGRRVAAVGGRTSSAATGRVVVFDLPADLSQPTLRQDDFQTGNAPAWTPLAGSSFAVATTAASRVYRQSSLAGNAASLLTGVDWNDQSIQADVRPTAFDGADRWFGLVTRYTDANNYYYVAARRSNVIQLRRMVNGVFTTLASANLPVALNVKRNLRLEAVGTLLRVFVDDALVLQARDTAHTHGRTGLMMFKTRADYDNVIVSPTRRTTLYQDDFGINQFEAWTHSGTGEWSILPGAEYVYQQTSVAGGARAVTPIPTGDQIVQARAMATSFGSGAGRWFGLLARYQDDNNYYYVTVRNDNTIGLRKLVNGAIVELDVAPLAVTTNTWYTLRLEAIGQALRVYVNGQLTLEARDTSFAEGTYGLVTYKTATRYDDFIALQP